MKSLDIAIIGECMVELQRQDNVIRQGFGGDTRITSYNVCYTKLLRFTLGLRKSYPKTTVLLPF